jgi:hypothetical protein
MAFHIVFVPQLHALALVEIAILLLGYLSYRVSLYDAWHEKWLNDRDLAESLRGAMFAALVLPEEDALSTLPQCRSSGPSLVLSRDPLPFHDPTQAWFVATMKRIIMKERRTFSASLDLEDTGQRTAVAAFLMDAWLRPQASYHYRNAERRRRLGALAGRIRLVAIIALTIVAALHAIGLEGAVESNSLFERVDLWIAFATVALPAWAAASHLVMSLDGQERLAERSEQMAPLLEGLAKQIEGTPSLSLLRDCVIDAQRVMELETREWAESMVDRRPEFTG